MKNKCFILIFCLFIFLTFNGCASSKIHEHEWQDATCERPRKCKTCDETEGSALGHQWQDATCLTPRKCIVCGKTEGKKADHVWGEATCEEREKCVVCGIENSHSKPLGHEWIPATIDTPSTCAKCRIQSGEPIPLSSFNRGRSGQWMPHPSPEQYVGLNGYVAVTHEKHLYNSSSTEPYDNDWLSRPWYATIYEKNKQFCNPIGKVEHKTPVKVIGQELTDWDHATNSYDGFLFVERIDNGQSFYIAITDFIVEPYWENMDTRSISYSNPCLAVYHQKSEYYPVNSDNKKYNINDNEIVFVNGETRGVGKIDSTINTIDVLGKNGRGFFNADDLTIIY